MMDCSAMWIECKARWPDKRIIAIKRNTFRVFSDKTDCTGRIRRPRCCLEIYRNIFHTGEEYSRERPVKPVSSERYRIRNLCEEHRSPDVYPIGSSRSGNERAFSLLKPQAFTFI